MKKRTMAILLSLCMVLSLLPGTAKAEGAGNAESRGKAEMTTTPESLAEQELVEKPEGAGDAEVVEKPEAVVASGSVVGAGTAADAGNKVATGATVPQASVADKEVAMASEGAANTEPAGNPIPAESVGDTDDTGTTIIASGDCGGEGNGSNVTWELDSAGCLTIQGTGEMKNWNPAKDIFAPWYPNRELITSVKTETGVTSIGAGAFYECGNLTDISIPEGIMTIGGFAFQQCSSLEAINIPEGVTSIKEATFFRCGNLKEISLPKGVTTIGSSAFARCSNLKEISLPKGVTTIGSGAFYWCTTLTSISIPEGVTSIGGAAFMGCYDLRDVRLPEGVTSIERETFSFCLGLTSINIPLSVTEIKYGAFGAFNTSYFLSDVSYAGTRSQWRNIRIDFSDYVNNNAKLFWHKIHCIDDPTITYDANGGSGSMNSLTWSLRLNYYYYYDLDFFDDYEAVYRFPENGFTAPEGKIFKGWSVDGKTYAPRTVYDLPGDITAKAIWAVPEIYSMTYDANGGTGKMASATVTEGDSFQLPDCGFTAPKDKKFKAWSINDTEYAPGVAYKPTGNVTIKPVWEDLAIYTITYDANGGTGKMASATVTEGNAFKLPDCGFTAPTGKTFKAWSIDGKEYAPGTAYEPVGKVTVKAVWDAPEKPAITGFTLTGTITGHKDVAYTSVTAALVGLDGKKYAGTVEGGDALDGVTKKECAYSVTAPAGQYSLEVEAVTTEGVTVNRTAVVKLKGEGQTKNVNLPNGLAKSKVEVGKSGAKVLVGGLDDLMMDSEGTLTDGAKAVEVTFAVDEVKETAPEAVALKDAAPGQTLEFYDFTIMKTVDGAGKKVSDTGAATVEIVLPFDKSGKGNVKVYRYHEGSVDILTEAEAGGERIALDGESITIYAKKFSVYAVGYAPAGSVEEPGTTTPPAGPGNPKSPDTGDDSGVALWGILAPCALAVTFAARRRRRTAKMFR